MTVAKKGMTAAAMVAVVMLAGLTNGSAQQAGAPARAATELGNFGDVPFVNPQIIITKQEDRATWRKLEDKHLRELREFEDKVSVELRALRVRQADEREAALKQFVH
jgi:hypothetical protein